MNVLEGEQRSFSETGELILKGNYLKNQKCGDWDHYDDEGRLLKKEIYKNGEKVKEKKYK